MLATPAQAQWTVFDPTNYVQNVLTAARSLQQITNQITSLQNEAQMLINQARNLASLPYSSLQQLQQSVQRTQQLLQQAQNIAYDVQQIDQAFQTKYANVSMSASDTQLIADAKTRWQNTVGSLQDAMRVQATVVGNIDTNRTQMSALVGSSQSATGALQATQAGNQLLALQAQQLADEASHAHTKAIVADVGFGIFVAGGAACGLLYFLRPKVEAKPSPAKPLAFAPWAAPQGGGLTVSGAL